MPNLYKCSDGSKVSEAAIQRKLSEAYREFYLFCPIGKCEGCAGTAQCTAHIIPKARLKQLGMTELIWNHVVWFRSCFRCNMVAENPESDEIKTLLNYQEILEVTKRFDPERYSKMI